VKIYSTDEMLSGPIRQVLVPFWNWSFRVSGSACLLTEGLSQLVQPKAKQPIFVFEPISFLRRTINIDGPRFRFLPQFVYLFAQSSNFGFIQSFPVIRIARSATRHLGQFRAGLRKKQQVLPVNTSKHSALKKPLQEEVGEGGFAQSVVVRQLPEQNLLGKSGWVLTGLVILPINSWVVRANGPQIHTPRFSDKFRPLVSKLPGQLGDMCQATASIR